MAYDKVVDSARLDGALTATADAIRGKTGSADGIQWDADTGFAAAVDAITGGTAGIYVESTIYTPNEDCRWVDATLSKELHDGCFLLEVECTNSLDEITELSGGAETLIYAYMVRHDMAYVGVVDNRDSFATTRRHAVNGELNSVPMLSVSRNNYIMGVSRVDNLVRFAGGSAVSVFRVGLTYRLSVYYTRG